MTREAAPPWGGGSPLPVIERITARSIRVRQRVVLPEAHDPRVLEAAREIRDRGYAEVILVGDPEALRRAGNGVGVDLDGMEVVDPAVDPERDRYVERLREMRRKQGLTREQADTLLSHPVYYGAWLVADGRAGGMVAGSACPTSDTIRAALWSVGTAPGCRTVSSCSIMQTHLPEVGVDGALVFADTGVVPEPTVEQLADIAIQAGEACRTLLGEEPRVAMISFSTRGSASGPAVRLVADATHVARERRPDMSIDGEMQVDAALVPEVAARKAADSGVAGQANVLVFPNLSTGNAAYKLVERLGRARALGPLLLGLDRPINDVSRGCSAEDIVLVAAVTSVQAADRNGRGEA